MTPLEVLKNKKKGTILYSPYCGYVTLNDVYKDSKYPIEVKGMTVDFFQSFMADGKYQNVPGAQVMLFPSVNLKEWDKFNFKEGDILEHENGMEAVEFISYDTSEENPANNYTIFKGKVILPEEYKGEINYFTTWCFKLREKAIEKKFKPFDKVLYINNFTDYQLGFVEKHFAESNMVRLINVEDCIACGVVYPYKDEMEKFIGETATEEREKELKEILANG